MDFEDRFAKAILEAQRIREESYDKVAADKAEKERKDNEWIDFERFYTITLYRAANVAAEKVGFDLRMNQPIYLLIKLAWNDIQAWGENILKVEQENEDPFFGK